MIVPKSKSKADICGMDQYTYLIRPDIGSYMRWTQFMPGEDLEILSLHSSHRNGDHYLANDDGYFYIVLSDDFYRVTDLTRNETTGVFSLHPKCRGGSHYSSASEYFYIIFQDLGVYRRTKNMATDEEGEEFALHSKYKNGLYYFGLKDYNYFVNPYDQSGEIKYTRATNFNNDEGFETFSFHPSIYSFLPGGLAIDKGPSFGEWVRIKTIDNDSQKPIEWKNPVTKKVGFEKKKMSSIEHNWKVSADVSTKKGDLTALLLKAQFSLPAEYGGSSTNTEREDWNEVTDVKETIRVNVKPRQSVYIYRYQMGLGKEPVLHCRDMRILDSPDPPTDNPLPPA